MSCYSLALVVALLSGFLVVYVQSHGYLFDPPGRSTVWRIFEDRALKNYDDNALYCGTRDVCMSNNFYDVPLMFFCFFLLIENYF